MANVGQMTGADVDALRGLAQRMGLAGQQLERIQSTMRAQLYGSPWKGRDAEQFRREWDAQHARVLRTVAAELARLGQTLALEARQQEAASAAGGGSLATGSAFTSGGGLAPPGASLQGSGDYTPYLLRTLALSTPGLLWKMLGTTDDGRTLLESVQEVKLLTISQWTGVSRFISGTTTFATVMTPASLWFDSAKLAYALATGADKATVARAGVDVALSAAMLFPPAAPFAAGAKVLLTAYDLAMGWEPTREALNYAGSWVAKEATRTVSDAVTFASDVGRSAVELGSDVNQAVEGLKSDVGAAAQEFTKNVVSSADEFVGGVSGAARKLFRL